jgi:hypothetical protein
MSGGAGAGGTASQDGGVQTLDAGPFTCSAPLAVADFDGDGVADCLITTPSTTPGRSGNNLLFHKGIAANLYSATAVITPYAVPLGVQGQGVDLSGDGCADLVLSSYDATNRISSRGYVPSLCDGTFGPIPFPSGIPMSPIGDVIGAGGVGDFNGDGRRDLWYATNANDAGRSIYWITLSDIGDPPSPGLTEHQTMAGSGIACGENGSLGSTSGTGDFNNDGNLDAMTVLNYRGFVSTDYYYEVIIALGDGQGGFSRTIPVTATMSTTIFVGVSIGDFNADGNLDLSVSPPTATTTIYYGDGAGNFSTTPP